MQRRIYDTKKLSPQQLDSLVNELHPLTSLFFKNISEEVFRTIVLVPEKAESKLYVYQEEGKIVGFHAIHWSKAKVLNRVAFIFRQQALFLPEIKGQSSIIRDTLNTIVYTKLKYPFRSIFGFYLVLNPISYHLLDKYAAIYYPNHAQPLSHSLETTIEQLAEAFDLTQKYENQSCVRRVALQETREYNERTMAKKANSPAVQFFLKYNPEYYKGYGLLALTPYNLSNLVAMTFRLIRYKMKKRFA